MLSSNFEGFCSRAWWVVVDNPWGGGAAKEEITRELPPAFHNKKGQTFLF